MPLRDLLLLVLIFGSAVWALRQPWIGALMWTFLSIASPHTGLAWTLNSFPVAQVTAITTLIGLMLTRERQNPFIGGIMGFMLAFVVWTSLTLPFSYHFDPSFDLWVRSAKIWLMLFVTVALIDTKEKLHVFVWVCAISIGLYSFKGGIFTLATGGSYRVWGPGGFVGGNNEFAVAMIMTIPLIRYLQMQMPSQYKWRVRLMTAWMVLTAIAALGSHSRGALVAIFLMVFFLWLKAPSKVVTGFLILSGVAVILPFMPESWWDRMRSISTYQEDESAQGRFDAWGFAWELAKDRFPFGGGFMVSTRDLFAIYAPGAQQNRAAHSIYFQVLGEHGWVGLILFLGIGFAAWKKAGEIIQNAHGRDEMRWAADLARMVQVSLIGFAGGGAFLSLAYYDLPFNCAAIIALTGLLTQRVAGKESTAPSYAANMYPPPPAAGAPPWR